ncbi:unnamed protein product [Anisakis simplex]|uniref:Kazal-like domain-containing protein n=1 Tax=Anisakis simplex TaxID=6269 RepID=A0A0M3JRH4_ANISI|nr:unnamed protein product [Anisakis simplex]
MENMQNWTELEHRTYVETSILPTSFSFNEVQQENNGSLIVNNEKSDSIMVKSIETVSPMLNEIPYDNNAKIMNLPTTSHPENALLQMLNENGLIRSLKLLNQTTTQHDENPHVSIESVNSETKDGVIQEQIKAIMPKWEADYESVTNHTQYDSKQPPLFITPHRNTSTALTSTDESFLNWSRRKNQPWQYLANNASPPSIVNRSLSDSVAENLKELATDVMPISETFIPEEQYKINSDPKFASFDEININSSTSVGDLEVTATAATFAISTINDSKSSVRNTHTSSQHVTDSVFSNQGDSTKQIMIDNNDGFLNINQANDNESIPSDNAKSFEFNSDTSDYALPVGGGGETIAFDGTMFNAIEMNQADHSTKEFEVKCNQSVSSNNGTRGKITEVYLNRFIGALQAHEGMPCSAVNCTKTFEPVCDSNGRTHKNICLFYFYLCKLQKLNGRHVRIVHEGGCEKVASVHFHFHVLSIAVLIQHLSIILIQRQWIMTLHFLSSRCSAL